MKIRKSTTSAAVAALLFPMALFAQTGSTSGAGTGSTTTGSTTGAQQGQPRIGAGQTQSPTASGTATAQSGSTSTPSTGTVYGQQQPGTTAGTQGGQQSGSVYGSTSPGSTATAGTTGSARSTSPAFGTPSAAQDRYAPGNTAALGGSLSMASADVKKIREQSLDNKVTASKLIGKTVVDREGNEIGEVRDIGLSDVVPQGFQQGQRASLQGDRPSTTSPQQTGAMGDPTAPMGARASDAAAAMTGRQVNVYVSTDDDVLLQVPLRELSFNQQEDELRLDMARQEIDRIAEESVTASIE